MCFWWLDCCDVKDVVCLLPFVDLVDEKERKNGNDPEKELADSGFHDYRRPLVAFILAFFCADFWILL